MTTTPTTTNSPVTTPTTWPAAAGPAAPLPPTGDDPVRPAEQAGGAARAEAQALWVSLTRARGGSVPSATAAAEDALFRFYLPVARALGDGAVRRSVTSDAARHAAEVGLAQAVLSWPGSDDGFLRYASRCITNVLRHLPAVPHGRPHPLSPLILSSRPRGGRPG